MASKVQIAKLALQNIGDRYDIASLTESTPEAEQVNLVLDDVRDALLREYPWKFALKYVSPASLSGTPPASWSYMYTYPVDALKVWRLVNPLDPKGDSLPPLKFTVGRNAANAKVVFTDESEPEFEYTAQITDTEEYDANFVMALSWRIAEHIAIPLTGNYELANAMARQAESKVGKAMQEDGNEGISREQSRDPDWLRARV